MNKCPVTITTKGKWRYAGVHDSWIDASDDNFNLWLQESGRIWDEVGPGPFRINRSSLAARNGIISPFFTGTYEEFLKTEKWRKERGDIMEIFESRCLICRKRKAIHVHHQTYQFGWLPIIGDDPPPLIPVCKICHIKQHM